MKINDAFKLYLKDFTDKLSNTHIEKTYIRIYENNTDFGLFFSYFHSQLNLLLDFLNKKSKTNRHYNADESRALISLIEELQEFLNLTSQSQIKIILEQSYKDVIDFIEPYLRRSGGSLIPENFNIIVIKKHFIY